MDERIRSDSVLALGKKIVDELDADQPVDTLSRWMAQYIAEKIEDAKNATDGARDQKMSECSDAILKLWAHRSELPNGKRPFEDFEPIFRVIESLDPDDTTPYYFRQIRSEVKRNDEDESTTRWLDMASELDDAARALIRYCLVMAARDAVDKSRDWVTLAEAIAEKENNIDINIVNLIMNSEISDDPEKAKIEGLLKKLEKFTEFSSMLTSHFGQPPEQATTCPPHE